ncbi:MAG: hypothetical protein LBU60_06815 [Clostridiales bacterium]|jgi:hypothetical protein|nr:hypothetical protein [Clostridiales bacterium]
MKCTNRSFNVAKIFKSFFAGAFLFVLLFSVTSCNLPNWFNNNAEEENQSLNTEWDSVDANWKVPANLQGVYKMDNIMDFEGNKIDGSDKTITVQNNNIILSNIYVVAKSSEYGYQYIWHHNARIINLNINLGKTSLPPFDEKNSTLPNAFLYSKNYSSKSLMIWGRERAQICFDVTNENGQKETKYENVNVVFNFLFNATSNNKKTLLAFDLSYQNA